MLFKADFQIVRAMIDRMTTDKAPSHDADRALSVLFGWTKGEDGKWSHPGWYHGKSVPMSQFSRHFSSAEIMADALFADFAWTLSKPRLPTVDPTQRYQAAVSRKDGSGVYTANGATAAMALISALLRAYVATGPQDGAVKVDVILDLFEVPTGKTPYEAAHEAGLRWENWTAQPQADQVLLHGVTGIPSPMPPFMRIARPVQTAGGA